MPEPLDLFRATCGRSLCSDKLLQEVAWREKKFRENKSTKKGVGNPRLRNNQKFKKEKTKKSILSYEKVCKINFSKKKTTKNLIKIDYYPENRRSIK